MSKSRRATYWPVLLLLTVAVPIAVLAALDADGLARLLEPRRALFLLSLLMTGTVAGLFVGTELGQRRVQEGLDALQFGLFKQRFERAVGGIMPPVLILTTLSPVPLLFVGRRGPASLALVAVACALWIAATAVTVVYNVPVNTLAGKWDPAHPPENWELLRARWHLGQSIRTALTLPGFACLVLAALTDRG